MVETKTYTHTGFQGMELPLFWNRISEGVCVWPHNLSVRSSVPSPPNQTPLSGKEWGEGFKGGSQSSGVPLTRLTLNCPLWGFRNPWSSIVHQNSERRRSGRYDFLENLFPKDALAEWAGTWGHTDCLAFQRPAFLWSASSCYPGDRMRCLIKNKKNLLKHTSCLSEAIWVSHVCWSRCLLS